MRIKKNLGIILLFFILIESLSTYPYKAAENIYLYRGTFSRTISIKELKNLTNNKSTSKKLNRIIKLSNQSKEEIKKILEFEITIPINIVDKLLSSSIGETILTRISQIIYPNKYKNRKIGLMSIRSALLTGSIKNKGKLNVIQFFEAYPNKNIAIDINSLSKTLNKIESLKELIEFYSNSPLEKLKEGRSKT